MADESAEVEEMLMSHSEYEDPKATTRTPNDYVEVDFEGIVRKMTSISRISDGGLFWVVDQLPGRLHAEDMTEQIVRDGYWLGTGIPYFEELADIGQVKANGTDSQRHSIQEKILNNITDLDGLAKFIRQSAYRGDLDHQHPTAFGNIDMKLFAETNASNGTGIFQAYSGPLYDPITDGQTVKRSIESDGEGEAEAIPIVRVKRQRVKPFDWDAADTLEAPHEGQPTLWNFKRQTPTWAWI